MSNAVYPSLSGRSVFITGGGQGIGEATVRLFAQQGAKVGFVDIADGFQGTGRRTQRRWWFGDRARRHHGYRSPQGRDRQNRQSRGRSQSW